MPLHLSSCTLSIFRNLALLVYKLFIQLEENMKEQLATIDYDADHDDDHDWDNSLQDLDLVNISDDQYLRRILGPRRMGFEVQITS